VARSDQQAARKLLLVQVLTYAVLAFIWLAPTVVIIIYVMPPGYGEGIAIIPVLCLAQLALGYSLISLSFGTWIGASVIRVWPSSLLGLIANGVVDGILLGHIGIMGAAVGSLLGYLVSWAVIYRTAIKGEDDRNRELLHRQVGVRAGILFLSGGAILFVATLASIV
jgi:hypothetical protein